ncbi:MAG: cytochrome c3 family protein [Saprospiraceae bacterium]
MDFDATTDPAHSANQFPTDCTQCHDENAWIPSSFDHNTAWPLEGEHQNTACIECHIGGNYSNTPTTCVECHQTDFDGSTNPNHGAIGIPTDCETCHTPSGWSPADFPIHDNYYQLNGAHAAIADDCVTCHNGDYNNTPNTCVACHQADFDGATNPNHISNQFPTDCATCHTETTWVPTSFDHNTVWPLEGEHLNADCIECHVAGNYSNTPNTCVECHQTDFDGSANPNHGAIGIPTDCETCHTPSGWSPANFPIHNDYYQLNGAHALAADDCAACHNGDYNNTPNTCFECHQADYSSTTNPDHAMAQFNTDCVICHNEDAWIPSEFNHDLDHFPIYSGAHLNQWMECIDCHTNPADYSTFSCTGCHTNPQTDNEHMGVGGYSYTSPACLACHPTGDADNIFDHSTTSFPLTGVHLTTDCLECHASGFAGTPTNCSACHQMDFDGSTNPNHGALGIPTDCEMCHVTSGWDPAAFPIHDNYYPLNGAHTAIADDCVTCHNGDYNNTPNTCVACHQPDFDGAANPSHTNNQFPTDCIQCHNENAWVPSSFDHSIWPLEGEHANVPECIECHVGGNYTSTPNTCVECHQTDYDATSNPDHDNIGINTDCETCHNPSGWDPALFPIHDNYYQLNGAHLAIADDCVTCHNGDYNNTPNTCVACHQADYDATNNPNHADNQFPTDCMECHSETAWTPSTFDHSTVWPLNGAHADVPNCTDCHIGGNFLNTPKYLYRMPPDRL